MPQLGEYGRAYENAFEDLQSVESLMAQDPDLADTYAASHLQATLLMHLLEDNGAEADFAQVFEPVIDPEIEKNRAVIEGLRSTDAYIRGLISDADIDGLLAKLPEPEGYSDKDIKIAAAYWIGRALVWHWSAFPNGKPTETGAAAGDAGGADGAPAAKGGLAAGTEGDADPTETDPNHLGIKVFLQDSMLVINGQTAIPLARRLGNATHSVRTERQIETNRLKALQYLYEHADQEFTARQLWEAIDTTDTDYKRSGWDTFVGNFIENELIYNGQPLVRLRKPSPVAKIRYYSAADFNISFDVVDEDSGLEQLTNFKLPNDVVIGGKEGMVAHLLLRASADNLLAKQDLIDKGIYSAEDLASLKSSDTLLSSAVSGVRSAIREKGAAQFYRIHKVPTGEIYTSVGRPIFGYWMEKVNPDDLERAEKINSSLLVASYIHERNGLLEALGLPSLPNEIIEALGLADTVNRQDVDEEDTVHGQRERAFKQLRELLKEDNLELVFELPEDDPRWPLLNYLYPLLEDAETRQRFDAAMRARAKLYGSPATDDSPAEVLRIEYEVKGRGTVVVNRGATDSRFGLQLLGSFEQSAENPVVHANGAGGAIPHAGLSQMSRTERRSGPMRALRNKVFKELTTLMPVLQSTGLHTDVSAERRTASLVFPRMSLGLIKDILKRDDVEVDSQLSVEDLLLIYVGTSNDTDLIKATLDDRQRIIITEAIDDELKRFLRRQRQH